MKARKHFGQHFLVDGNIIRKIVAAIAPRAGETLVEIGPGRGALTLPLLETGARLHAVEIDRDLAAALRATTDPQRCTIHQGDALRFDFSALDSGTSRLRLVGNLPYNISTPLLFHLVARPRLFADLHVMVQKEVGNRIVASPGSREYGRLGIALTLRCRTERLFGIAPGCFQPAPKVDSVFLRLVPLMEPPAPEVLRATDRAVTQAFTLRRKRLSNALKGLLDTAEIDSLALDPGTRPEQLTPNDWLRVGAHLLNVKPALAKGASGFGQ
jgi:16S rRNA (adenine1518-N6/adenine1519-N6)-dimethyltransferase